MPYQRFREIGGNKTVSPVKKLHLNSSTPNQTPRRQRQHRTTQSPSSSWWIHRPAGRRARRRRTSVPPPSVRPSIRVRQSGRALRSTQTSGRTDRRGELQKIINALFPLRDRSLGCGTRPFQETHHTRHHRPQIPTSSASSPLGNKLW